MRKLILGAIAAFAMLAMGSSVASATETILLSPGGAFRASGANTLTLSGGSISIDCDLTFAGSLLTSAVRNLTGLTSAGSVTAGGGTNCGAGQAVIFSGLSWDIAFTGLDGDGNPLVTILGARIQVRVLGGLLTCNFADDIPAVFDGSTLYFSGATLTGTSGGLCPNPGILDGTVALDNTQTITLLP